MGNTFLSLWHDKEVESCFGYYLEGEWGMAELYREFNISPKICYKLVRRYFDDGIEGLKDRLRAPHHQPNPVLKELETLIVQAWIEHPSWGPRKLRARFLRQKPDIKIPATSTIGEILKRYGLATPRRRARRTPPYSQPFVNCNSSWKHNDC